MLNREIKQEDGITIELDMAKPHYSEKEGSVFIYDGDLGVWLLKEEYDKVDPDTDDLSHIPYLTHGQLDQFGFWEVV